MIFLFLFVVQFFIKSLVNDHKKRTYFLLCLFNTLMAVVFSFAGPTVYNSVCTL